VAAALAERMTRLGYDRVVDAGEPHRALDGVRARRPLRRARAPELLVGDVRAFVRAAAAA
jgi:hypothetical protein